MGHADYFSRNASSAAQLLRNYSDAGLKETLEAHCIGVAFDAVAATSCEGLAALDLLVRLLARLYPDMVVLPLDAIATPVAAEFEQLALQINPNLTLTRDKARMTICVIVGTTPLRSAKATQKIYMGSDGWLVKLSQRKPCGSRNSKNPFGAGVAACLASANVFRAVFKDQLSQPKLDGDLTLSAWDLNARTRLPNPPLRTTDVGDVHVAGLGAIGNGFVWAIRHAPVNGRFHLIDADSVDIGNLQRYSMTVRADETKDKAVLAAGHLEAAGRTTHAYSMTWEQFLATRPDWRFQRVVVAVDTTNDRIDIQASLPKWLVNGWTREGIAALSRHSSFADAHACLACLYIPRGSAPNEDQRVLTELHLDLSQLMEVRRRLDTGEGLAVDFLQLIANANGIPLEKLMPFEGKPLRSLYVRGFCSGTLLEFAAEERQAQAEVPMPFQSALSGILLAGELALSKSTARANQPNVVQIDLLRPFPQIPAQRELRKGDGRCICDDPDYQDVYRTKYFR